MAKLTVVIIDGVEHTKHTIKERVDGISDRWAKQRISMLRDGKMTLEEAYKPLRTVKDDIVLPVAKLGEKAPGWWERENLNPQFCSASGERCVL